VAELEKGRSVSPASPSVEEVKSPHEMRPPARPDIAIVREYIPHVKDRERSFVATKAEIERIDVTSERSLHRLRDIVKSQLANGEGGVLLLAGCVGSEKVQRATRVSIAELIATSPFTEASSDTLSTAVKKLISDPSTSAEQSNRLLQVLIDVPGAGNREFVAQRVNINEVDTWGKKTIADIYATTDLMAQVGDLLPGEKVAKYLALYGLSADNRQQLKTLATHTQSAEVSVALKEKLEALSHGDVTPAIRVEFGSIIESIQRLPDKLAIPLLESTAKDRSINESLRLNAIEALVHYPQYDIDSLLKDVYKNSGVSDLFQLAITSSYAHRVSEELKTQAGEVVTKLVTVDSCDRLNAGILQCAVQINPEYTIGICRSALVTKELSAQSKANVELILCRELQELPQDIPRFVNHLSAEDRIALLKKLSLNQKNADLISALVTSIEGKEGVCTLIERSYTEGTDPRGFVKVGLEAIHEEAKKDSFVYIPENSRDGNIFKIAALTKDSTAVEALEGFAMQRHATTLALCALAQIDSVESHEALQRIHSKFIDDGVADNYRTAFMVANASLSGQQCDVVRELLSTGSDTKRAEVLEEVIASSNPTLVAAGLKELTSFPVSDQQNVLVALDRGMQNPYDRKRIEQIFHEASTIPDLQLRSFLEEYRDNITEAQKLGITRVFRFYPETLKEIVAHRKQERDMGKNITPQAILVIAQDDPTGAFARTPHHFAELSKKMNLLVYEVSNEDEFARALNPRPEGKKADLVIIAGHGTQSAIAFGPTSPENTKVPYEKAFLDISDLKELSKKGVGGVLKDGGQVVLNSCSTGRGGVNDESLARQLKEKIFTQAATDGGIVAPLAPSSSMIVEIHHNTVAVTFDAGTFRY
jgi:hypothetical protein